MLSGQLKKEYVLVSDQRSKDSVSTTDFTLRLAVPIKDVVKTDLVQVAMNYNVANEKAPNNTFKIGIGSSSSNDVIVLEGGKGYTLWTYLRHGYSRAMTCGLDTRSITALTVSL